MDRLESIAEIIAEAEKCIQANENEDKVKKAQQHIILLSRQLSLEDLLTVDELVQKKLKKV